MFCVGLVGASNENLFENCCGHCGAGCRSDACDGDSICRPRWTHCPRSLRSTWYRYLRRLAHDSHGRAGCCSSTVAAPAHWPVADRGIVWVCLRLLHLWALSVSSTGRAAQTHYPSHCPERGYSGIASVAGSAPGMFVSGRSPQSRNRLIGPVGCPGVISIYRLLSNTPARVFGEMPSEWSAIRPLPCARRHCAGGRPMLTIVGLQF